MPKRTTIHPLDPRKSLTEMAYEQLKDNILRGAWRPEESLSTAAIAKEMQVSSMPVREALTRLQTEGWVKILPQRGVVVSEVTIEELRDNSIIRTRLEGLGAYLACSYITKEKIAFLRNLIHGMRKLEAENFAGWFKANTKFHDLIVQCSGNKNLIRLVRDLRHLDMRSRLVIRHVRGYMIGRMAEHERIVEALAARKADLAESAMRAHLLAAGEELVKYLSMPPVDSSAASTVIDGGVGALRSADGRAKPL